MRKESGKDETIWQREELENRDQLELRLARQEKKFVLHEKNTSFRGNELVDNVCVCVFLFFLLATHTHAVSRYEGELCDVCSDCSCHICTSLFFSLSFKQTKFLAAASRLTARFRSESAIKKFQKRTKILDLTTLITH